MYAPSQRTLERLVENDISCNPAVMKDFVDRDKLNKLRRSLIDMDPILIRGLEFEELKLYPHVKSRLKEAGLQIPSK